MQWVPLRVTADLDTAQLRPALSTFIPLGKKWSYDKHLFRVFRWYGAEENKSKPDRWLEYSDTASNAPFTPVPGRLFWLKAGDTKPLDFGAGYTPSLKDTVVIPLAPGWSDFSLPFKSFTMYVGDIIKATGVKADTLEFYHWKPDNGAYTCDPLFVKVAPTAPSDPRGMLTWEPQNCGYTVYNPTADTIKMRLPPTPAVLSTITGDSLTKRLALGTWAITMSPRLGNGTPLSSIQLGYVNRMGAKTALALPPSFSDVTVGLFDRSVHQAYGALYNHRADKGGYAYELVLSNNGSDAQDVGLKVASQIQLPDSFKAISVNPLDGSSTELGKVTAHLDAGATQYRLVFVGGPSYLNTATAGIVPWRFDVLTAYPNPFRNRIAVKFTLPYYGVHEVRAALFDGLGRQVWSQKQTGMFDGGVHQIVWSGTTATSHRTAAGMYVMRLTAVGENGRIIGRHEVKMIRLP
jgi:hypothetical protein